MFFKGSMSKYLSHFSDLQNDFITSQYSSWDVIHNDVLDLWTIKITWKTYKRKQELKFHLVYEGSLTIPYFLDESVQNS